MSNQKIVEILAKDKTIETLVVRITKHPLTSIEKDLCQDLYLNLLQFKNEQLNNLYDNKQINYYIVGMIRKSIFSSTSRFYSLYKKFDIITNDIADCHNI